MPGRRRIDSRLLTQSTAHDLNIVTVADAVLTLIESDNPPPQLLLGSDALKHVTARIERLTQEIEAWKGVTVSTDG